MKHLKWYQRFKSIQSSMTFAFVCLIALIIAVSSTISLYFVRLSARDSAVAYTDQIIGQMSQNIEYYIREMENVVKSLTYSFDVREYFDSDLSSEVKRGYEDRIRLQMTSLLSSREDILAVSLFGYDGERLSYEDKPLNPYMDVTESEWFKGAVVNEGDPYVTASYVQNLYEGAYPWVVSMSSEFKDMSFEQSLGILVIDMNYKIINDICNQVKLGNRGYVYILDKDGSIVWHPNQKLINTGIYEELTDEVVVKEDGSFFVAVGKEKRIYTVTTSELTGWRIVGVAYEDELVENLDQMTLLFLAVAIISILIAYLIAMNISATLSRPIKRLKASMQEVREGNLEAVTEIDNRNEIGDLSHTFNAMTKDIRHLIDENTKEQKLKRQSELKALQAQINPHFLYNTLDSIIWMSMADKKDEVVEMTSSLAKLFRLSINRGNEMIAIRDEVEHVRHYLTIQKYRYSEKLTYDIEMDDNVQKAISLKLILQPVIENAIYHGIKHRENGGHIDLAIWREEDNVIIRISDDGVGMSPNQVKDIFHKQSNSTGSGVGVKNVYERLKLYYGDLSSMRYESELDVGTTVVISFPYREEEVTPDEELS